jgi:hypothetical protein
MQMRQPPLTRAQVAEALCALETRWPERGKLVAALNGKPWMPWTGCVVSFFPSFIFL